MARLTPEEIDNIRKLLPMFGDNIATDVITGEPLYPPGEEIPALSPDEIRRSDERGSYFVDGLPEKPIALYRLSDRVHEMYRGTDWTDLFQGLSVEDQRMAIYNWQFENDRASVTVARAREIAEQWGYEL
jgi:hypothetical protein